MDKCRFAGLLGFFLCFIAVTYPLASAPLDTVVSHLDDMEHGLWTAWWYGKAIESSEIDLFRTSMLLYISAVWTGYKKLWAVRCVATPSWLPILRSDWAQAASSR